MVKNDGAQLKTFKKHQKQSRRHLIEDASVGLRLKQEFLALVEKQYNVRPKAVLGKDIKEINDWVSQQTGRKVQGFLASNFQRNSGANAVSAAYFKGRSDSPKHIGLPVLFSLMWCSGCCHQTGKWVTRFGQSGEMDTFQVVDGAPVSIPMMKQDNYPVKMGVDSDLKCTVTVSVSV